MSYNIPVSNRRWTEGRKGGNTMMKENIIRRYTELADPTGAYQDKDCLMGYSDIRIAEAMVDIVEWFAADNPGMKCHSMNSYMKGMLDAYMIEELGWKPTEDFRYMRSLDIDSLWMTEAGLEDFDYFIMTHTNLSRELVRRERKKVQ